MHRQEAIALIVLALQERLQLKFLEILGKSLNLAFYLMLIG